MSLATLYCLSFLCACVICLPAVKGTRVCGLLYPETETRLKIPRLQVSYNVACIASRIVCAKFEWQSHEGNSQEGSGEKQFIVAAPPPKLYLRIQYRQLHRLHVSNKIRCTVQNVNILKPRAPVKIYFYEFT